MTQTYEPAAVMPPPPETLSEQARAALTAMVAGVLADIANIDIPMMRAFSEQVQQIVGAEQQKAYPVTIAADVVGGVPVRRITRASGDVDRRRVLMNLHRRRLCDRLRPAHREYPHRRDHRRPRSWPSSIGSRPSIPFPPRSTMRLPSTAPCSWTTMRATSASMAPRPAP